MQTQAMRADARLRELEPNPRGLVAHFRSEKIQDLSSEGLSQVSGESPTAIVLSSNVNHSLQSRAAQCARAA